MLHKNILIVFLVIYNEKENISKILIPFSIQLQKIRALYSSM